MTKALTGVSEDINSGRLYFNFQLTDSMKLCVRINKPESPIYNSVSPLRKAIVTNKVCSEIEFKCCLRCIYIARNQA